MFSIFIEVTLICLYILFVSVVTLLDQKFALINDMYWVFTMWTFFLTSAYSKCLMIHFCHSACS